MGKEEQKTKFLTSHYFSVGCIIHLDPESEQLNKANFSTVVTKMHQLSIPQEILIKARFFIDLRAPIVRDQLHPVSTALDFDMKEAVRL